jgi:2,4-dienoyl-CoA reductase (NADPH2)
LLAFYAHGLATAGVDVRVGTAAEDLDGFGAVVWATGAEELVAPAGAERSSSVIAAGPAALAGARHVAVVDDGFGWWPGCNVVELALAAGVPRVTYLTPGTAFAGGIPAESRVQLLQRLNGAGRLEVVALAAPDRARTIGADRVVAVGERRPRALPECAAPLVLAVGDAIVPRRAAHAIAEGRAAGEQVADALSGAGQAVAHVVV